MEDSPNYGVTLIADAPATLSFEAFCQEAVARTLAVGPQFLCLPAANHWPEHNTLAARTDYRVQIWDTAKKSFGNGSMGKNIFSVESRDPEKCLRELGRELAGLKAKLDYDAATTTGPSEPAAETSAEFEAQDKGK